MYEGTCHYRHNALHQGRMSTIVPIFCVVHTQVDQVWSVSFMSSPPSPPPFSRPGAKVFYLSWLIHSQHPKVEDLSLGRFMSVMKFRPLEFRSTHPTCWWIGEWCCVLFTGLIAWAHAMMTQVTCWSHDLCHMQLGHMEVT